MGSAETTPRPAYGEARMALLSAVPEVVAREGLRGATYRAVARQAGVSHGSVSLHFGSREAMIREAYAHAIQQDIARSSLEPRTGDVDEFVAELPSTVAAHPENSLFQYELMIQSAREPELAEVNRGNYGAFVEASARELERMGLGGDPALARFVAAALDGVVLHQILGMSTREEVEEELEALRQLLRGLIDARRDDAPAAGVGQA